MRRETLSLGLAFVAGLAAVSLWRGPSARAQSPAAPDSRPERHIITTSGTATVTTTPDSGRVYFGLKTIASSVKAAREQNDEKVHRVRAALLGLKIPSLKMKSVNLEIEPLQKEPNRSGLPTIVGYQVLQTFTALVTNSDPEKLSADAAQVLDTVLSNGSNVIEKIHFFREDPSDARREALRRAVEDAVANARAMATGAKANVTDVVRIEGTPQYSWGADNVSQVQVANAMMPRGDTTVVAGNQQITCSVQVTCAY